MAQDSKLQKETGYLRAALQFLPDGTEADHRLAVALAHQGNIEEAQRRLRQAMELQPSNAEAYYTLGNVLMAQGKHQEALSNFRQALQLRPDHGDTCNNLGVELIQHGSLGEATAILRQAVRLRPDSAEAHNNLGLALAEQGRFAEAEDCYERALQLNPLFVEVHVNLADTHWQQRMFEEAMAGYQYALLLRPDSVLAHCNRGLAFLQRGNFEKGWPEYEWFRRVIGKPANSLPEPFWDGSDLGRRSILLHMEQGVGDMLQFIRYAHLLKERGATVIVECPPSLVPLFSRCPGIDQLIATGSHLPDFDFHAPLMSLPRLFPTTLATIPARTPYVFAAEDLTEHWRQTLRETRDFKIGIAWQGNPRYKKDHHRSIALSKFAPLARVGGVRLVSLQKGPGVEQLRTVSKLFSVVDFGVELDTKSGAFMDTAAIMKNLDLVVTSDTSIAHLAGALGVPVWVALSKIPDWRWLLDREDSPWYPTMRLFRQTKLGDWDTVFERIASEVKKLIDKKRGQRSIRVEISPGELLDKIAILQIKAARIADVEKLRHVRTELEALTAARERLIPSSESLAPLSTELQAINEKLWDVENDLRLCEGNGDFGSRFTELARSVYRHNDRRAEIKRKINELLGASVREQKYYTAYGEERTRETMPGGLFAEVQATAAAGI